MQTRNERIQARQSTAVRNGRSHPPAEMQANPGFVDERPTSLVQQRLQKIADDSPSVERVQTLHKMTDQQSDPGRTIQRREGVVQRRFDAGIGSGWHIHYGEHVKYASTNATRVNFSGRTRRQIGYAWEQAIQANGLAGTKNDSDFIACKTWIRDHID